MDWEIHLKFQHLHWEWVSRTIQDSIFGLEFLFLFLDCNRRYMAEILSTQRKTLLTQSHIYSISNVIPLSLSLSLSLSLARAFLNLVVM